jgi:hypothetical protein
VIKEVEKKQAKLYKTILLTGCGGPLGYETLRLPYFLDSWLKGSCEVVGVYALANVDP